ERFFQCATNEDVREIGGFHGHFRRRASFSLTSGELSDPLGPNAWEGREMNARHLTSAAARRGHLYRFGIGDLTPHDERTLLLQLAECKRTLAGASAGCEQTHDPVAAEALRTSTHPMSPPGSSERRNMPALGAIGRRYLELRSRLALGSMRLVSVV